MIRTGGSLMKAALTYRDAGATRMLAIATHGVLPGNALAEIKKSGLFERVVVTDSHPRVRELAQKEPFLQVEKVAPIFAPHLRFSSGADAPTTSPPGAP
jgi:ribose-phosphate pyrophosphokinase